MKLAAIFLICNQLRAASSLKYFRNSFNKNYFNEDVTNKYDFTEFSFPRHGLKNDFYQDAESSKDSLINGLKEIIKHEKINNETKLNIIYYFLDLFPGSERVSEDEFKAVKDSTITNELFINLAKKNTGLAQHLNLLYDIIQLGEIKNIISFKNSSCKSTEQMTNNFIDEIGVLINNVIFNITKKLLLDEVNKTEDSDEFEEDNSEYDEANSEYDEFKSDTGEILYYLDNAVILFKDLIMMNDITYFYYDNANSDLNKVGKYINLIENFYNNNHNNMTVYDIRILFCVQNYLEFTHNAIKLCCLASAESNNQDTDTPDIENPNIIVSKMIIDTLMLYFWAMPDLKKLYECVITDGNIDFWNENNMLGYIHISEFFYINKKSFNVVFPEYYDWIIENLGNDNVSESLIHYAKLLVKYLQDNTDGIKNKTVNFNVKEIIENVKLNKLSNILTIYK